MGFAMMNEVTTVDSSHFSVVVFSKSQSSVYAEAVEVAECAATYQQTSVGKRTQHCAIFSNSPEQIRYAMRLTQLTCDWKGAMYFARGRLISPFGGWAALEVLSCIETASQCNDWKAHCLTVKERMEPILCSGNLMLQQGMDSQGGVRRGRYLFPCTLLTMYFELDAGPTSTLVDQVQAKAVARNVDWCPYFDLANFRPLDGEITV